MAIYWRAFALNGRIGKKFGHGMFAACELIECSANFGLDVWGQPPAFAGARHHLVGDLLSGDGHEVLRLDAALRHESGDGLRTEVAL